MKPVDETWNIAEDRDGQGYLELTIQNDLPYGDWHDVCTMATCNAGDDKHEGAMRARAQLAAQAPAAMRLLLKHQWTADSYEPGESCPECGGCNPDNVGRFKTDDFIGFIGHTSDCSLLAVLRAAGVLT